MRKEIIEIQSLSRQKISSKEWMYVAAECEYWLSDDELDEEERTALGKIKNRALQKIQALRQNEENKARKKLRNKLEELYPSSKPLSVSDALAASKADAFFH